MLVHELTAAECGEFLARAHLGHLACTRDNQPYIVPVFFDFDASEHCLYSFATAGQKIEWMRTNPKVCVEIEEIQDRFNWLTVLVFGRFEELDGSGPSQAGLRRAQSLFEQRSQWWQPAAGRTIGGPERTTPVFYRIRIDTTTGRRVSRPERPASL